MEPDVKGLPKKEDDDAATTQTVSWSSIYLVFATLVCFFLCHNALKGFCFIQYILYKLNHLAIENSLTHTQECIHSTDFQTLSQAKDQRK